MARSRFWTDVMTDFGPKASICGIFHRVFSLFWSRRCSNFSSVTMQKMIFFAVAAAFGCGFIAGNMLISHAESFSYRFCAHVVSKIADDCPPGLESVSFWFARTGTDKFSRHHYERYYEVWLGNMRCQRGLKIVEIGANSGESLQAWEHIFPYSDSILGIAYGKPAKGVENHISSRISILWGDQSKKETMDAVVKRGPWDLIIDDGSHVPQHMVYTLFSLWQKALKPGGMYIIEDLETNYWPSGAAAYGYPLVSTGIATTANYSAVKKIDQIREVLMRFQIGAEKLTIMPGDEEICSIEWGMNIVRLQKCTMAESERNPLWSPREVYDKNMMDSWLQQARSTNPAT